MKNAEKIINYLRAGFSSFWIRTSEHEFVKEKVYPMITEFQRKDGGQYTVKEWNLIQSGNPVDAINQLEQSDDLTVLFAYNMHWFADNVQVVQTIKNQARLWSSQGKALICVSHTKKIPPELEKEFVLIDLPLPNGGEIESAVTNMGVDTSEDEEKQIINACKGLSRTELDNVLALSVVEGGGKYSIETINDHKAQVINKTGFLEVLPGELTYADMIGQENIKEFVGDTITNPRAKGIITIGPPGTGKTTLMKAIVGEFNKFGLSINMGSLFSKFQGETDQNINTAIEIISSIGDCLVLIDEFEKQFAGSQSDGTLDSGTTRRATGRWLDFLQNRPEGVYIVATANSFQGIPNEYLRPGRWDTSPFFIDYPTEQVADAVLTHYCKKQGITVKKSDKPDLTDFSPAEIEALVHIASMRGITLMQASDSILPQAKVMGESITQLREWAKDRTIPAEKFDPIVRRKLKRRKVDV